MCQEGLEGDTPPADPDELPRDWCNKPGVLRGSRFFTHGGSCAPAGVFREDHLEDLGFRSTQRNPDRQTSDPGSWFPLRLDLNKT